ncbi:MAG: hypothetical protein MJ211_12105 [Bacteroidales bacterium]|nr:hypothetical protein [Bacteroidales bacterium]
MRIVINNILIFIMLLITSCEKEVDIYVEKNKYYSEVKIAIVMPLINDSQSKELIQFALDNLKEGQLMVSDTIVNIKLEYYDESSVDIAQLADSLVNSDDIFAVIGPIKEKNINIMANIFSKKYKTMITPNLSSESILRRYSVGDSGCSIKEPFLWSICGNDVLYSQVILAKIYSMGYKHISILVPEDDYGQTFYEYMPFQASELNIKIDDIEYYTPDDNQDLTIKSQKILNSNTQCVICIANNSRNAKTILENRTNKTPKLFFTDGLFENDITDFVQLTEGLEGFALYINPSTGFLQSMENKFGKITGLNARIYESIILAGISAICCNKLSEKNPNNILKHLLTNRKNTNISSNAWNSNGISLITSLCKYEIQNKDNILGIYHGAIGDLSYDSDTYTTPLESCYAHYLIYEGEKVILDYLSNTGKGKTSNVTTSWNYMAQNIMTSFDDNTNLSYSNLEDKWAVLICGSNGWKNYRHEADVLNVYHLLKSNNFPDDHIIFLMADDIAQNKNNKNPGIIKNNIEGENLYQNFELDYRIDSITSKDINDIFLGIKTNHLPIVLDKTTEHSNILIYWSGHGSEGSFQLDNNNEDYTTEDLCNTLKIMSKNKKFRKIMFIAEPCKSSSVLKQIESEDIKGIIALASSDEHESSFANYWNVDLNVWMSDRFTNCIVNNISKNFNISLRDLYTNVAQNTIGSHVKIYNSKNYGNLSINTAKEFFVW